MQTERLYHISENGHINMFVPRPSPSEFKGLVGDVVFAITEKLLHNYLFPRDCPRVCYYPTEKTTASDKEKYLPNNRDFIIAVEEAWITQITQTTLYCYELPTETFELLDACAGYYVSQQTIKPISVNIIENPLKVLLKQENATLNVLPNLWKLAEEIGKSSLNFSLIRMRNARK